MNWIQLDTEEKREELSRLSNERRVLVFMFSNNNTLNYLVKYTIEREWNTREMEMPVYIVDPDNHQKIASELTTEFGLNLYSPLAFIIEKGKCLFSVTDGEVDFKTLRNFANPKQIA